MCEIRKVGFEGADLAYATRRPPRVTCTVRKFCSRLSGNGFAAIYWVKSRVLGRNAKDDVVGGGIRSSRTWP
jgi:hypothetical protein